MSNFVELRHHFWLNRDNVTDVWLVEEPYLMVGIACTSGKEDMFFRVETEAEADKLARRIAGHEPEWVDSAITDPRTTLGGDSDFGPFIEGIEASSGQPFVFRIERMRGVNGMRGAAACFVPFSPYYYKAKGFPDPVRTPDFWRHIPVEEKMELSRKLYKLKCEEEE